MKALTAIAVVTLLFVVGCPGGQKTADLQAQVEKQEQQITQLQSQVNQLTMERDSLQMLVDELSAGKGTKATPGAPGEEGKKSKTGGTTGKLKPPTKR